MQIGGQVIKFLIYNFLSAKRGWTNHALLYSMGNKESNMTTVIFLLAILAALIFYMVSVYNTLISMIESVENDKKQIQVQLDRRFKVFESLIEVVKKYMDYEKSTFKEVVALRSQSNAAKDSGDLKGQIAAEDAISKIASCEI